MKRFIVLPLALFGLAVAGCAANIDAPPDPAPSPGTSPSPETARMKVAETTAAGGQKLEIYSLENGSFAYTQSAPFGTPPVPISEELWNEGNPVKIYQAMSPGRPVPQVLLSAIERAKAFNLEFPQTEKPAASDPASSPRESAARQPPNLNETQAPGVPVGIIVQQNSGATGLAGCPASLFDLFSLEGNPFCPPNAGNTVCWHDVSWSYIYNPNGRSGYAAVCSQFGTPRLNLHEGNSEEPVASWDVPAGNWQYVRTETVGECHTSFWFYTTCSHWHGYYKWQVRDTGGISYQMGARVNPD